MVGFVRTDERSSHERPRLGCLWRIRRADENQRLDVLSDVRLQRRMRREEAAAAPTLESRLATASHPELMPPKVPVPVRGTCTTRGLNDGREEHATPSPLGSRL